MPLETRLSNKRANKQQSQPPRLAERQAALAVQIFSRVGE